MQPRGFTLIEIVVVLVVLGILSLRITLSPDGPQVLSLKAEAQSIVSQLRRAQFHAISGNKRTKVSFAPQTYSLEDITYNTAILDMRTGLSTIAIPSDFQMTFSGLPNNYVVFDSQGTPYINETNSRLAQSAIITITYKNQNFQVEIQPSTGQITLL